MFLKSKKWLKLKLPNDHSSILILLLFGFLPPKLTKKNLKTNCCQIEDKILNSIALFQTKIMGLC
uniref:Putative ovule protein n=1 Tax=Solanum chacoense TaxID=4108 RepID=A0A0V0HQG7_SOLCH